MTSADPESVGLSSARLRHIDAFLKRRYLEAEKLPHCLTLIARKDRVVHESVQGLADIARGVPARTDTIFRIYSMTKPVTSIAFMMLMEEGLIALDDPVHRVIPEWRKLRVFSGGAAGAFETVPTDAPMRMIDLLRHTAGLTYGFQERTPIDAAYRAGNIVHGDAVPLAETVARLAEIPLEYSPGSAWSYSVATDVLGYVVEKVSAQPLGDFFRDRIFKPLGMTDTGFWVPAEKAGRLAACYQFKSGGFALQDDPASSPYLAPPRLVSGGGGLVSTARDYLQLCRMLLGGGAVAGVRLLSPKSVALMTANHLPDDKNLTQLSRSMFSEAAYSGVGFGLGFAVTVSPAKTLLPGSVGDFFWGGMASTYFWVDPVEDLIVIFMTQFLPSTAYPVRRELRSLVYSAFTESYARRGAGPGR